MSSGQRPRWPDYFPRMKHRGRHRKHEIRLTVRDENNQAIWPPTLHVNGHVIPVDQGSLQVGDRVLNNKTGYWEEAVTA